MAELTTQQRHALAHIANGGTCPWATGCPITLTQADYLRHNILTAQTEIERAERLSRLLKENLTRMETELWEIEHSP